MDARAATRKLGAARRAPHSAADRRDELPRLLYTREESARVLGMSLSHFQRHVQPRIPCVYVGQLRQYRPEDLKAWAEREASERR
ncbi:MAG TPA: hypothetical protein VHA80_12850 [Solirubrobacterales bacterium]|nr:hypothetical protein [Solirubrobacterales bacterium]